MPISQKSFITWKTKDLYLYVMSNEDSYYILTWLTSEAFSLTLMLCVDEKEIHLEKKLFLQA